MVRRVVTICVLGCVACVLNACIAIAPRPDGTVGVSFVMPGSTPPTGTVTSSSSATVKGGSGAASTDTAANQATRKANGPRLIGTPQESGSWKINVESVDTPSSLPDGTTAGGGKELLVVNVTAQNIGNTGALQVLASQFKLMDTHGRIIAPAKTSLPAYNAQDVPPIEPGMGGATSMVYEVVKGSTGYGFVVTPKQSAKGSLSWIVP